jgi:hypothetical protein
MVEICFFETRVFVEKSHEPSDLSEYSRDWAIFSLVHLHHTFDELKMPTDANHTFDIGMLKARDPYDTTKIGLAQATNQPSIDIVACSLELMNHFLIFSRLQIVVVHLFHDGGDGVLFEVGGRRQEVTWLEVEN